MPNRLSSSGRWQANPDPRGWSKLFREPAVGTDGGLPRGRKGRRGLSGPSTAPGSLRSPGYALACFAGSPRQNRFERCRGSQKNGASRHVQLGPVGEVRDGFDPAPSRKPERIKEPDVRKDPRAFAPNGAGNRARRPKEFRRMTGMPRRGRWAPAARARSGYPSVCGSSRRFRTAYMTASIRECRCSFSRMFRTWFLTVFSEM